MRKSMPFATSVALVLALAAVAAVTAHEGSGEEEVVVEPAEVTAGESVIVAGSGLEPDDERVLVLAGGDLVVDFGSVTTDAEGMFEIELTIPSHLPSGTYELRAIGDETLTAELMVTAMAGGAETPPAENDQAQDVVPRDRTPVELGLILILVALAGGAGGLLVWRAEWFRGAAGA
ncbi:MAG: hypothetical protein ABIO99_11270 [Candidatus Limnocylindria bacterium]